MHAPATPRLELGGDVEVRETHISWVFLAGDRAYKVKKPVVLAFLDYGTAERRRQMCRAEVELNRRLAPRVYRGVRGLVPAADGRLRPTAEDDPAAVDYAVEMARYDEADTLAARVAAGTVTVADLAAVGERLAAFHAAAEPDRRTDGAEAVKRTVDDNFATLHGLVVPGAERAAITRGERSAAAFVAAAWDELDRRATEGRVRDGHGDLRLEHVLLRDGVEAVDCVEFDPGLRRIDVAADLAFLVMELYEAGRPDLAAAMVRAYRDAGGDAGDDRLVSAFAAYRAEVRAKVSLLRAGQLEGEAAERKRARARALLPLGLRLCWRARAPLVVVLAGLSGAGKSTVAAALAAESGFPHLNSDVVRKQRAGVPAGERAPLALYAADVSLATYAELGRVAAAHARDGVIVDATFRRRAERDAFRAALGSPAPVLYVECRAPAAVLEARARARAERGDSVSDAGPELVRRQLAEAEPLDEVAAADHLPVRSDRPVPEIVAAIADALDARRTEP